MFKANNQVVEFQVYIKCKGMPCARKWVARGKGKEMEGWEHCLYKLMIKISLRTKIQTLLNTRRQHTKNPQRKPSK